MGTLPSFDFVFLSYWEGRMASPYDPKRPVKSRMITRTNPLPDTVFRLTAPQNSYKYTGTSDYSTSSPPSITDELILFCTSLLRLLEGLAIFYQSGFRQDVGGQCRKFYRLQLQIGISDLAIILSQTVNIPQPVEYTIVTGGPTDPVALYAKHIDVMRDIQRYGELWTKFNLVVDPATFYSYVPHVVALADQGNDKELIRLIDLYTIGLSVLYTLDINYVQTLKNVLRHLIAFDLNTRNVYLAVNELLTVINQTTPLPDPTPLPAI